jgi:hypothetical protein
MVGPMENDESEGGATSCSHQVEARVRFCPGPVMTQEHRGKAWRLGDRTPTPSEVHAAHGVRTPTRRPWQTRTLQGHTCCVRSMVHAACYKSSTPRCPSFSNVIHSNDSRARI